jgi:uncharacterized protein YjbI with pentapeptide repeats
MVVTNVWRSMCECALATLMPPLAASGAAVGGRVLNAVFYTGVAKGAVFEGAHLEGADFRQADLKDTRFAGAWLREARSAGAQHLPPNVAELLDLSG